MDETAIAFEPPHVRAAAGASELDRISVRDYLRHVEIGAFTSERGVEQRVRFNVVLEVCHHAAAEADDVDQVVSYDGITRAIDAELAQERINLLETLAERVARRCLADPRAVRVFVRVEKLDRIPGALGVEIVRRRAEGVPSLRGSSPPEPMVGGAIPWVVFLPSSLLWGAEGLAWRDALAGLASILALGPVLPQAPASGEAALRAGLLAIDQAAWTLAAEDPRFTVATSRAELDWGVREGRPLIWAPTKLVTDAVTRLPADASRPAELALWLAGEIGAAGFASAEAGLPSPPHLVPTRQLDPERPAELAALRTRA
jgi:7,8-dihydroneopterin aldolase/epimerase/oxygenase